MKKIIAFVGPSRSGKSTLIRGLRDSYPELFCEIMSVTTRERRGPEDDTNFRFLTREDFIRRQVADKLVQWVEYAGNLYGNDREMLDKQLSDKYGLMAVTESGVQNFRDAGYELVVIRVLPVGYTESPDELRRAQDKERAEMMIPVDFTLINSFAPGGQAVAAEELREFLLPLL